MRLWVFSPLLLSLLGCNGQLARADAASLASASRRVAVVPLPFGVPVGRQFAVPLANDSLTFETIASSAHHALAWPAVVGKRTAFALALERTPGETSTRGWVYAGRVDGGKSIIGFLDAPLQEPSRLVRVVVSDDDGKTFYERAAIEKPDEAARFESVRNARGPHWDVEIVLEACADCEAQTGRYAYRTDDAGAHWRTKETPLDTEDTISPSDEENH